MPRRHELQCAVVLVLLAAAALEAQDHPRLSGRWVLESASQSASEVPRALSVSLSLVRTNERGPMKPFFQDLTVVREFESGTRSETYPISVTGGRVPGVPPHGSPEVPVIDRSVQWEGHALVIERRGHTGSTPESGVRTERREVWSLDPDGRLRVVITTRASPDAPQTATLIYRRQ
jgi:hypothetical protein